MDGDYLSLDDLQDTPSLSEMLEEILKEEEKEKAKEPKTQEEQCVGGRHGRIVECDDGDMCSACGRIAYYYLKQSHGN